MDCVFVHGWMVTERVWSALTPLLGKGALTPRLRMASARAPAEAELAALTLDALATEVLDAATRAGLDRFHLVGHSMGGQIAQLVAATATDRVRSLSLVNPVPLSGLPLPPEVATMFRRSGGDRSAQGGILGQACRQLSPDAKDALLDDAATIAPAWIARALDLWTEPRDGAALASIACPTLVVATDDPFLPPAFLEEAIVARIRGARLATIAGPGHYPQNEQPDALASTLRAFLVEVER